MSIFTDSQCKPEDIDISKVIVYESKGLTGVYQYRFGYEEENNVKRPLSFTLVKPQLSGLDVHVGTKEVHNCVPLYATASIINGEMHERIQTLMDKLAEKVNV